MGNVLKYFDCFSGIGGFTLGIEKSKDTRNSTNSKGRASQHGRCSFRCVGYSEIDKYASAIYKYHFPKHKNYGDIRTIMPDDLPDFDLFTFGFPCQDLSIAGKRGGLKASRSGLFFEAMRIVRAKKPKYFVFENVKGLFSSNGGQDFFTVLKEIADAGYDGQWQLLNTRWFLPQNRERIYFVGYFRGTCRPKIFPIGENYKKVDELQRQQAVTNTIKARHEANSNGSYIIECEQLSQKGLKFIGGIMGDNNKMWLENGKKYSRNFPQGQRVYSSDGISCQLTAQGGGWGGKTGLYAIALTEARTEEAKQIRKNNAKNGKDFSPRRAKQVVTRKDNVMNNLTANRSIEQTIMVAQSLQTDGYLRHGTSFNTNNPQSSRNIRRLTPRECEHLQGFPEEWTKYGIVNGNVTEISDTQRYKCLGNAVSVPVVIAVLSRLIDSHENRQSNT